MSGGSVKGLDNSGGVRDFNLNQTNPAGVARALRQTAEEFREDASMLAEAWQDPAAGLVWRKLATTLEYAALKCERIAAEFGFKQSELR